MERKKRVVPREVSSADGNRVRLRYFRKGYAEADIGNELKYVEEDGNILFYSNGNTYFGYGKKDVCTYSGSWIDLDELKKVMKEFK